MGKVKPTVTALDELFGDAPSNGNAEQMIPIASIHAFKNHPFKVLDDDDMADLVESIDKHGVLNPILVRTKVAGGYELISGHRRKYACEKLRLTELPAIIKDVNDDEAVLLMVDSNIQRKEVLPSEKAWAYRMKSEALNRQGMRTDLTSRPVVARLENDEDSKRQIQRYIRLTYLTAELLEMVDDKFLKFRPAVEISYLHEDEQHGLLKSMTALDKAPSLEQAVKLKKLSEDNGLTIEGCYDILADTAENKARFSKVKIKQSAIDKYVPPNYTRTETENLIEQLLREWAER